MKISRTLPFLLLTCFLCTCTEISAQQTARQMWLQTLQESPQELQSHYSPDAVRVFLNGNFVSGAYTLSMLWQQSEWKIQGAEVLHQVQPHVSDYQYEIAALSTASGTDVFELSIWNLKGPSPVKELELLVPASGAMPAPEILEPYRKQWMELCNAHKVEELVNTLYHANTLYYNHRPMVVGREALIPAYAYMKHPDYSLRLEPIAIVPVRSDLIFEVGQCSGSYPGKYILVWQKNPEGNWEIILDSNI